MTLPARDALAALPVQTESRPGYERSKFKHWTDADNNGCNTRTEVLLDEAVTAPPQGPSCSLTGGGWYSPYHDRYLDSSIKLDVDRLVPLAETWDCGASQWSSKKRELYANDLDDARDQITVPAASSHRSRTTGAGTSPTGSPTRPGGPSIDTVELNALTQQLADCPDAPITGTLAR
ncbi:HNH endonuclease [Streptomyces sp. NBC_01239]|uniref:HNH endonuclease n=1 Tax=Streptomyces sp. NBC_01239 TaxID=2903792 RepID=UPI00225A58CB|nr:HNH endonuclease [Streptomyces sp. NBC_01239]MCX4816608.1 HNH endonuclease [Streptomyces sp. NBC_01239]